MSIVMMDVNLDFNMAERQNIGFQIEDTINPIDAFQEHLAKHDYYPKTIVADNAIHRFSISDGGDSKKNKDGFYALFTTDSQFYGAYFGDWKTGNSYKWHSVSEKVSETDWVKINAEISHAQEKLRQQQAARYAEAKAKANEIWQSAQYITSHPYLTKKGVRAHNVRLAQDGRLIIPYYNDKGEIVTLEYISSDGEKRFLTGGEKKGSIHIITRQMWMKDEDRGPVCICEGYSTGATIHESTGREVVVVGSAGEMINCLDNIVSTFPGRQIVFCADNDRFTAGNPGIKAARDASKKLMGSAVVYPEFQSEKEGTDFNDLATAEGIDKVREQIGLNAIPESLSPLSDAETVLAGRIIKRPPPREYILNVHGKGLYPKGVLGVITATGGVGKTYFLMRLASILAGGQPLGPLSAPKALKTLFIAGEDDEDEVMRRFWDMNDGTFPRKLHAVSVYGEVGPLMRLNGGTPERGEGFKWLDATIKAHDGLQVLIIDPKSRFYGLDENNADHATQWIQTLEYLIKRHRLYAILFSHHTAKSDSKEISQNMSRGSAAIVDGCRFQGGMIRLPESEGGKLGIQAKDVRKYVKIDFPKMNYSEDVGFPIILKRGAEGVLEYCEPHKDKLQNQADYFHTILQADGGEYTLNQFKREKETAHIYNELVEQFPGINRRVDVPAIIEFLCLDGRITKEVRDGKTNKYTVYIVK